MFKNLFLRKISIVRSLNLWLFFILTGLSLAILHFAPRVTGQSDRQTTVVKKQNLNTQACSGCGNQSDQGIYIPLIDLPEAEGSQIVFNSRSAQAVNVTPVFYTAGGEVITGDPVSVNSLEIRYVDLKTLIPIEHRNRRDWGGLSLKYYGGNRKMWAQFRFLRVNGGNNVDEFFIVEGEQRSDTQAATWWTPPGSTTVIALGNVTDAYTSAIVQFGNGENQSVSLAPHATATIRHPQVNQTNQTSESVAITITGAAGSIIPTGIIEAANHNSNSVIRFYDTKNAKQPNLYGNGLTLKNTTPHLILNNTSPGSLVATPKFIPEAGAAANPVQLPPVSLEPYQSVEVNLNLLMNGARSRHDLDTVSVEVDSTGSPGSLIGALYTTDNGTKYNYDIPLRDSGPVRTMTGSYPWKADNDYSTVVYITNITDIPQEFVGQINFDGGTMGLKPRRLAPGETAEIDLQKLRDEQKTDDLGRKIPNHIRQGQFRWATHGVTGGKLALIGRAVMTSKSNKIMTSYSCNDPCPPEYGGWITPTFLAFSVNEQGTMTAWEVGYYNDGWNWTTFGPYQTGADWTMDSYNYCSMGTNYVATQTFTGVAEGTTNVTALIGTFEHYTWDGRDCYDDNFTYDVIDGGPVETHCYVPRNFHQVGSGTDTGNGTLHFEYAWESSSGNLSDLSVCFVGEIVTYPGTGNYTFPSPPFPNITVPNPTTTGRPGNEGAFQDNHSTPGSFVRPYSNSSFTATQYYRYSCPCKNGGAYVNVAGPNDIVRTVSRVNFSTPDYKFTITKSGASATINPLP